MTSRQPVMIYRQGTELECGPREDQLVVLPGVAIGDFVARIVECGFPRIRHVHCKDPARHVRYDFPIGRVRMVFTDGQFSLPSDASTVDAPDFLAEAQLIQASYLAHVKTFEAGDETPGEGDQATPGSQVLIVSTFKACEIREIFAAAGLDQRHIDLSFYRGSLL
jgi:hypothetical protein